MRLAGTRGLYGFTHQNGAIGVVLQAIGEAARLGRSRDWIRDTAEMTAAKLRAYGAAIPALRAQLVELVGELLADPQSRWHRQRKTRRIARQMADPPASG